MKKSFNFTALAAIAAMLSFTACLNEDFIDRGEASASEAVNFNVQLGDMSVTRAQATDTQTGWNSSIDGTFAVGDRVFIYTKDADGKWYKKQYNVTTAAPAAAGNNAVAPNDATPTGKFYWQNSTERKQYEIYSYGKNANEIPTVAGSGDVSFSLTYPDYTVAADQTNVAVPEEFLFGYGSIYYCDESHVKTLKLSHQLARIDVIVKTAKNTLAVDKNDDGDTDDDGEEAQTAADMQLFIGDANMSRKGSFVKPAFTPTSAEADAETVAAQATPADQIMDARGTWTLDTENAMGAITPRVLVKQTFDADHSTAAAPIFLTTYSAVVMPQDFHNVGGTKVLFHVEYDGATYKFRPTAEHLILPGYHYTYTIEVTPTALMITNVSITNWDTASRGGEGECDPDLQ